MTENSRPSNEQYFNLFQRDPVGQAILDDLSRQFYDSTIFDCDPYRHAFNSGKREVVAYLLKRCRVIDQTEDNE